MEGWCDFFCLITLSYNHIFIYPVMAMSGWPCLYCKSRCYYISRLPLIVTLYSHIQPVSELENDLTILDVETIRGIVVCIHQKEVGHGAIAPLKARKDVVVLSL